MQLPTLANAGSSSSTPATAGPSGNNQPVDLYRSLPKAFQKDLASLLPPTAYSAPPPINEILNISSEDWSKRVAYKNLLISGDPPQTVSPLVIGKKRNRGYPELRAAAARDAKGKQKAREQDGFIGERKRKRLLSSGDPISSQESGLSYQAIAPLHHLHNIYLSTLLSLPPLPPRDAHITIPKTPAGESIQSHLLKADFTGALLRVRAARNPSLNGLEGIVIEETSGTFRLVCADDRTRTIAKKGTQFTLAFPAYGPPLPSPPEGGSEGGAGSEAIGGGIYLDPKEVDRWAASPRIEIDLMGSAFGYRSGERAGRKFRPAQGGGGGSGWGEPWVRGEWSEVLGAMESSTGHARGGDEGVAGAIGKRKRGKARRKDPPAWGRKEGVA